jgi:hypothetical protein
MMKIWQNENTNEHPDFHVAHAQMCVRLFECVCASAFARVYNHTIYTHQNTFVKHFSSAVAPTDLRIALTSSADGLQGNRQARERGVGHTRTRRIGDEK